MTPVDVRPPCQVVDAHVHLGAFGRRGYEPDQALLDLAADQLVENGVVACFDLNVHPVERRRATGAGVRDSRIAALTFEALDTSRYREDGFERYVADRIASLAAQGVAGIKVWKDLGATRRQRPRQMVAFDDPRFDCVWGGAGAAGLIVVAHIGDPRYFFERLPWRDQRGAEVRELRRRHLFRKGAWGFDELLAQQDRVLARHPNTTFVLPHCASNAADPRWVEALLARRGNAFVDLSGCLAPLGRRPREARHFIEACGDRILFGTDYVAGHAAPHQLWYRFLQTEEEGIEHTMPGGVSPGAWHVTGLGLEPGLLVRIYRDNAAGLLRKSPVSRAWESMGGVCGSGDS